MATAGPNLGTSGADVSGIGSYTWTNPGNATAEDGVVAESITTGGSTHWLQVTGYGFSIPSGSTINGIAIAVKRCLKSGSSGSNHDGSLKLIKGGTVGGNDKAATGTNYPSGTLTWSSDYGSSADLWGLSWLYSDINASNFGVALSVTGSSTDAGDNRAQVDAIRVTVTYTAGASGIPNQIVEQGQAVKRAAYW